MKQQRATLMITRGLTRVEAPACIDLGMRSIAMSPALRRLASVGPPYRGGGGASSGLEGPQSCRGQGAHAPCGRQDGKRTHRVATSPASRRPSSLAHPMAGSAPHDPAGFAAVASGDVAPTGMVQERDRWSQISNECGVDTQEPVLFMPERDESNGASVRWGPMTCEVSLLSVSHHASSPADPKPANEDCSLASASLEAVTFASTPAQRGN
jgi:hypothetical protein